MSESNRNAHFVIGTLVGGALAGAAALLLAPKKGSELREDIYDQLADKYEQFEDVIEDYTSRRFWTPEPEPNHTSLVIGTVIGGLLAAGTALLMAPKTGAPLRKNIIDLGVKGGGQIRELVEGVTRPKRGALDQIRQRLRKK